MSRCARPLTMPLTPCLTPALCGRACTPCHDDVMVMVPQAWVADSWMAGRSGSGRVQPAPGDSPLAPPSSGPSQPGRERDRDGDSAEAGPTSADSSAARGGLRGAEGPAAAPRGDWPHSSPLGAPQRPQDDGPERGAGAAPPDAAGSASASAGAGRQQAQAPNSSSGTAGSGGRVGVVTHRRDRAFGPGGGGASGACVRVAGLSAAPACPHHLSGPRCMCMRSRHLPCQHVGPKVQAVHVLQCSVRRRFPDPQHSSPCFLPPPATPHTNRARRHAAAEAPGASHHRRSRRCRPPRGRGGPRRPARHKLSCSQ